MEIPLKRRALAVVAGVTAVLLAACSSSTSSSTAAATPAKEKLKVAFVYIGVPGDAGWTYMHDQGRKDMEAALGDPVESTAVVTIPPVGDRWQQADLWYLLRLHGSNA